MAQNSANVASAQPKIVGGFAAAAIGATLPTDATTALDAAFKPVGYLTDAGVARGFDIASESEAAWGGATVWVGQSGYSETFAVSLMESKNIDALKVVFGENNVTESGTGEDKQIVIKTSADELPEFIAVFDMISGGQDRRIVAARCKISSREEIAYVSTESVKLGIEITVLPDANGNYSIEYLHTPVTP